MSRKDNAERNAAQPMAGQPRDADDEELQDPEKVPSFLTARELQARDPAKSGENDDGEAGERDASASFDGEKGEPTVDEDEPPRANRGKPLPKSDQRMTAGRRTR